ncbi:MAG TPA: hypothetical protein VM537_27315 [Anaerolineae bacterium]|nr:hypothetical protein [Anaerolineae bacterium]
MPTQPASYEQELAPNEDAGPNQWEATGVPHWAEIDEPWAAPDRTNHIQTGGVPMSGKTERFGVTLPNKFNLEGGFDSITAFVYAAHSTESKNILLNFDLYIKGAWQGPQQVTVTGGIANPGWYFGQWRVYNCDVNDADSIEFEIEVDPGPTYGSFDGVFVYTVCILIWGQDILPTADAKLSQFM